MSSLRLSLRARLLLTIALVLAPVLAILAYELRADYRRRVDTLLTDQLQTAQAVAALVDASFDEGLTVARALAAEPEILTIDPSRADSYLRARQSLFPQYENIALFDAMGRNVGSAVPIEPGEARPSISDRPYFQRLMATNREQVSEVLVGRIVGRPVVLAAAPVRGPDGAPRGAVIASLNLDSLPERLARVRLRPGQDILLADRTGRLAFDTRKPGLLWEERDFSGVPAIQRALAGQEVAEESFRSPLFGDYRMAAFAATPEHGWAVGVTQPTDVALGPVMAAVRRNTAAAIGFVLLALGLGLFVSQRVLAPVRHLTQYCQAARQALAQGGDVALERPVEVRTGDELEVLAESFNSMGQEVRRRIAEVEQANARLAALTETAEALVSQVAVQDVAQTVVERGMAILEADFAALWLAEVQRQELHLLAWRNLSPEAVAALRQILFSSSLPEARAARTGEIQVVEDYLALPPDELGIREIARRAGIRALVVVPLRARKGLAGVFSYARRRAGALAEPERHTAEALADMSAVALERAEATEDLRVALRGREEFLNLAAHELRTPLTTLKGYTQVLMKRGSHDEEERRLFRTINAQSDRIAHLIQTLVDVSQIQGGGLILRRTRLDLCGLVEDAARVMQGAAPRHQFATSCEGPAVVQADPERIREVLFNLLDNAVKYSPRGGPIETTVRTRDGEAVVCVRDYGVGIPKEKQAQLFQVFYQVAPMVRPTTGMGLGLYISREIVHRHGGQIWLESEEGRGSTFCFSLHLAANGSEQ